MRLIALLLAVVVAVCAVMLSRPRPKPVDVAAVLASVRHPSDALLAPAAPASAVFDPDEEPDEATLRRLVQEEYAEIERRGGMTLTLTATGRSTVVHPKVYTVRKETCRKVPHMSGSWECGVALTTTLQAGDNDPKPSGERVFVKRGPRGDWISG